ncbi:TetR/AcrR family transcriptional regulator [Actinotalea ferrariae]|uniref:TetR/AcrR family transcriptional regulator n=1 Tax=Actinotalea ferrariae TaxID=1386098 RepID=UPI001C8BEB20|nr:TetR/AcrR family transcriptional regulator [Actinotalea ferrariae]MBX9245805.1 TetR/AcrR family transcriptional regulator [Actinotalea ferrariae]
MPTNARDRLLDAAEDLFYAQGTRATGVEQILETSGVGRASFYRHFASKDELVLAYLERRRGHWDAVFTPLVRARGGHPLDVFDVLAERLEAVGYRGCTFVNTLLELPDPSDPAHRLAVEQKETMRAFFADLLAEHGYRDDDGSLARKLLMLYDGASVTGARERSPRAAHEAREVAEVLLTAAPRTGA